MTSLSHASAQGMRAEQQDRWVDAGIETPEIQGQLLAVIDGHGGSRTADIVARELVPTFENALRNSITDIAQAIAATVHKLDEVTRNEYSGTTLSLIFIPATNREAYVGVLGDSPIAILDSRGELFIGPLHNVRSNLNERAAAIARGGTYVGGYLHDRENPEEGLQLTRTLGDSALGRVLNREPDIHRVDLNEASFMLLATDGVLDSFDEDTDAQIRHLVTLVSQGQDADAIMQDALRRQTGDNVTVIVWRQERD